MIYHGSSMFVLCVINVTPLCFSDARESSHVSSPHLRAAAAAADEEPPPAAAAAASVSTADSDSQERVHCHGLGKALDWITKPLFKEDSESKVDTHLILFNRENRGGTDLRDAGPLDGILDISRRIYIIVHGFLSDAKVDWVVDMATALLDTEDADVLAVDWGGGAKTWRYWKAVANARVASATVTRMLQGVRGLKPQQVHCIGHSLGAHVCSFIAKKSGGLDRVTALDPAQLCFQPQDQSMQLGKQDARFVDVIHTSGRAMRRLGLGLRDPIGHVDFFLNGGKSQPGCSGNISYVPNVIESSMCSHGRAYLFFLESIADKNCTFWGHLWDRNEESVNETLSTPCTMDTCMEMGLRADLYPAKGSFYVSTADQSPFCDKVCYEQLGCFPTGPPWKSTLRPFPPPQSPEKVGTEFFLFTRKRPERTAVKTKPVISLEGLDFGAKRRTVFIAHGFTGNSFTDWMIDMKDAMLAKIDSNVLLVDWSPGAAGSHGYPQVAANTRTVGAEIARFIKYMNKTHNLDTADVHLIGHSLGAPVVSYAGKMVNNIGRLTALDPAQPGFEGYARQVRLDASDAVFVEVIHTDAKPSIPLLGIGMVGAYGDVDYYINGGFMQPGCLIPEEIPPVRSLKDFFQLPLSVIADIAGCPHGRANLLYTEVIRQDNCTFWGHPGNFVDKVAGTFSRGILQRYLAPSSEECTVKNCSPLSLENAQYPARGSFVVPTTGTRPFCISEPEVDGRMAKGIHNFLRVAARGAINAVGGFTKNLPRPGLPTLG